MAFLKIAVVLFIGSLVEKVNDSSLRFELLLYNTEESRTLEPPGLVDWSVDTATCDATRNYMKKDVTTCNNICDAKDKSQKDVVLLKDYVLVPTEYANDMLGDHLGEVETARQDSLAALTDLITNHTQYTTNQTAEVLVNVIRQAVDVLYPTYQDIRALVFPTTTLNQTISG